MSSLPFLFPLFFLILMATISSNFSFSTKSEISDVSSTEEMRPVIPASGIHQLMFNETRRRLGSFQICALCTCCGGPKGLCLPSPCCYAISCNIPNRPFGFCSFLPKTCNCFGCHL